MNALAKSSMLLLLATAIAAFLYIWADDEGFDPLRSRFQPQEKICKRDGDRLAQLQAKPSLDEAVRFGGELQCLQLWPQVETILDSLSHTARSTTVSSPNGPASNTIPASEAAPTTASLAMAATSAALDDACKHDADRLAELQAKPSIDAAIRFDSELRCPRLQPQLLAMLKAMSDPGHLAPSSTANSEGVSHDAGARTSATNEAPSASEAARDANQRVALPEREQDVPAAEVGSLEGHRDLPSPGEAKPPGHLVDSSTPDSGRISKDTGAERDATNETRPASQAAVDADRRIAELESEKKALATEVNRLQHNQESPPTERAILSASAATPPVEKSEPEPASQEAADAERRIAGLESEKEALSAEVGRLQREREASSTTSLQPAFPVERSEPQPASQAAADAERRIAALESEKEELSAEVSRLQHDREAPSVEQAVTPAWPPPAASAERSEPQSVATLASLPEGMPARVLIRYLANNADARAQAEKLASALAAQGVEVADVRESRSAIRPELSFSYAPDETIARQVGRVVGVAPVRRLQPNDGLMLRPGTVELNLSGDSHFAVIKTTSTRESNHE
jgi:hypothetical protein